MTKPTKQQMDEARELRRRFREAHDAVGTVAGGDGTPVRLGMIGTSITCTEERAAEYGCPPGEEALLIEWLPVGLMHDEHGQESGIDRSQIPAPDTWITFPRTFEGVNVYYKRGYVVFVRLPTTRHTIRKP